MDFVLVVITLGSFAAAFVNAAFATGGVYIILAVSIVVLPLTVAVPLQPVFAFTSLLARCAYFWGHIKCPIVLAVSLAALIGVFLGSRVFVSLPECTIALLLGTLLLKLSGFLR